MKNDPLLARVRQIEAMFRPTPIISLEHPDINLFAKLEFCNPYGSVKDKAAFWILKSAIERGDVTADTTVLESSSGNFANALSQLCRALGIKFLPVIDPNISTLNESTLRVNCEEVVKVHELDDAKGYLKTRLRKIAELQGSIRSSYWPNQYGNPHAVEAHYRFIGTEICDAFAELDFVFVGVSTCGTIAGVSRRVKEKFPNVKIIAVDARGSVIFGGAPSKRRISGIGATVVPQLLAEALIDDVVMVAEPDTVVGCHELLRHGVFAGGSSGSSYAAIRSSGAMFAGRRRPNVLFLCCDRGTAYLDSVFDPTWVRTNCPRDPVGAGT